SPVKTGLAFLPMVLGVVVAANISTEQLVGRFGNRNVMSAGMALAAVAMVLLTRIDVGTGYLTHVLPGLVLAGIGMGMTFAPGLQLATGNVRNEDAGVASALLNVTQQVGGSMGTALLNTMAASAA